MLGFVDLPFDVACLIFATVDDKSTLAACAQICRFLGEAAALSLYRDIQFTQLLRSDKPETHNAFDTIDKYPHLRTYVRSLQHIVVGPKPGLYTTYLHESLFWDAKLSQLPNLTRYSMSVAEMPIVLPDILDPIVHALVRCPKLAEVNWAFDVSHIHHPSLARLTKVKAIALGSPSSYALHRFVPWSDYFPALESLHIHQSHGLLQQTDSATLRAMLNIPSLKNLTIGPGHTHSKDVILSLLEGTPNLETLDMYYDAFLEDFHESAPTSYPGLRQLRDLTVRHQGVALKDQFAALFKWIQAVAPTPSLEHLELVSDDSRECKCSRTFVEMIRRYPSLQTLTVPSVHLTDGQFKQTVGLCPRLSTIHFAVRGVGGKMTERRKYWREGVP